MIRLLIVDNGPLMCDAMAAAVQDQPDILVVGLATRLVEAVELLPEANLVLAGASLPGDGLLQLLRLAAQAVPPVKIVAAGLDEDQVLQYLESGAAGYVLKEESIEDLLARLRGVSRGLPQLSPRVTAALMARLAELSQMSGEPGEVRHSSLMPPATRAGRLTAREQQVLTLLSQGLSNQQIAAELAIETGTVKNHVHSILRKLKVNSRYQAVLSVASRAAPAGGAFAAPLLPLPSRFYAGVG